MDGVPATQYWAGIDYQGSGRRMWWCSNTMSSYIRHEITAPPSVLMSYIKHENTAPPREPSTASINHACPILCCGDRPF